MKPQQHLRNGVPSWEEHALREQTERAGYKALPPDPAPPPRDPLAIEDARVVALRRRSDGWTAERQQLFLTSLANTGSVGTAAQAADITTRSAYRLRNHPKGAAFARAWDAALMRAAGRLTAVAFERAVAGTPRTIWRMGKPVATITHPSDRMLMFLLRSLMPQLYGRAADPAAREKAVSALADGYADAVRALEDSDIRCDYLDLDDWRDHPPLRDPA